MASGLRYQLVVLTHGRSETLRRTLDSFCAMVEPEPAEAYLYVDGPDLEDAAAAAMTGRGLAWTMGGAGEQHGFCDSVANAWADAVLAEAETDHVLWLENDFVFLRPVDLSHLADVLNVDRTVAQMAFCRGPANPVEYAAGGLVQSRPGEYALRDTAARARWLQHRSYWTTNPSLIRRDFMAANPWPTDGEPYCEGRFGVGLVERGYSFGVWGDGEPWVGHIGARTGFGY